MIFKEEPKDFKPRFSIVSCFCEHDGKIIILQRHADSSQGMRWGVPAGKIDGNETKEDAILREVYEETGISLEKDKLKYFRKVYVRYHDYDFIYHIFHVDLPEAFDIKIRSSEHTNFKWVTPKGALELPLVEDLDDCIRLYYKI